MLVRLSLLAALAAATALAQTTTAPTSPSRAQQKRPTGAAAPTATRPVAAKAPTTLDVVVQDARGRPLAGALVAVGTGRELLPKPHTGRTDARGRVRLDGLPRPPWDVSVMAHGLAPKRLQRVDGTKPLTVRLEPGATVTGVVRDGATRDPVASATVSAWVNLGPVSLDRWDPDAGRVSTATDARGRFRLEGLGQGATSITAVAPGIGRANRSGVMPGTDVELFLMPGATLYGVVRDESARPVRGAVVRAIPESVGWPLPAAERTDASGRFALAGLEAGGYVLVVRESAHAPGMARVAVEERGETSTELVLAEGGFVTGRLVDLAGKPTAGRVRLTAVDGIELNAFLQDLVQADAGGDGRFALGPVPRGDLVLEAQARGLATRDVEAVAAGPGGADLGDVVLETGPAIRGAVQDRQGGGIAAATVRAYTRPPLLPRETETNETGAFFIAGLPEGTVEVEVRATGYASSRQPLTTGSDDVVITLDAGGSVTGRLVDAKGQPVTGALVRAVSEDADRMQSPPMGETSDADGRFNLFDVKPGRYVVNARATGFAAASASAVRVAAGATADIGTLTLRAGGSVQGTVTDAARQPVAGARVYVEAATLPGPGSVGQSDASGAFQIAGLAAGRVDVVAQHPEYAPARVKGVVIDPEAGRPAEATVVMTRGGRIEGFVRRRDGTPFTGGNVNAVARQDMRGFGLRQGQPIREDGSFVLEHVAPGEYWLQVLTSDPTVGMGSAFRTLLQREVEVVDGETSRIEVQTREVLVTGRVTRAGEPVAGLTVTFSPSHGGYTVFAGSMAPSTNLPPGPQPLIGLTQADGGYELLVLEPGPYHASNRTPDGRITMLASRGKPAFEIPDVPAHVVDFTIGGATVAGIVVDQDTGQPIARAFVSFVAKGGPGNGVSDAQGRFTFDVEPGEGRLRVRAEGYAPDERTLSVVTGGTEELRIELSHGLEVAGRVVDPAGRPVGDLQVLAQSEGDASVTSFARVLPDGSFRLRGLKEGAYSVSAGSERAGFGFLSGVFPGASDLRLTLQPTSPLRVRVLDANGQPVAKAMARVESVGGVKAFFPGRTSGTSDQAGVVEFVAPEGQVTVFATLANRMGRASVDCRGGNPATVEVVLSEETPQPGPPR